MNLNCKRFILAVTLTGFAGVAPVMAVPISKGFAFFLNQSPFYAGAPDSVWDTNTTLASGSVRNDQEIGQSFSIANSEVALTWTGNELEHDYSQGGLAEATFLGGGTLTITGILREWAMPKNPVFNSAEHNGQPILTATIGAFHVKETTSPANKLQSIQQPITLTPTGGYLFNQCPVMQVRGQYTFSLVMASVGTTDGSGPLSSFDQGLKSLSSFMITFNSVPEPTALLLLATGWLALVGRRRRGGL